MRDGGPPSWKVPVAFYLLFQWVLASALSRGQGFWFFVVGLGPLVVAVIAARRGHREALLRLVAVVFGLTIAALAFEALLHARPETLKGYVADVSYGGYHWQRGGIYRLDPHLGPDLRPNFRRSMYWAGHWWNHDTNSEGYRGPRLELADAVVLGDSMIYGHGIETLESIAHHLGEHTSLRVANLGQQGTSLLQALQILRRKGLQLDPDIVFVSSHFNDLGDSAVWYSPEELQRFVEDPTYTPFVRPEYRPRPWWNPVALWAGHLGIPMRSAGILGAVTRALRTDSEKLRARKPTNKPFVPSEAELRQPLALLSGEVSEGQRLGWEVHVQAVIETKKEVERTNARLVLFDIGYPHAFSRAIEELAQDLGVEYNPAGRIALERALAGEDIYLANDGHWSANGSDVVALALARSIPGSSSLP